MFLRRHQRTVRGEPTTYWSLVECYRSERGPRQRVVAHLGTLDEPSRLGVLSAATGTESGALPLPGLAPAPVTPEWVEVDLRRVRVERSRAFGGAWLGWQVAQRLQLPECFAQHVSCGREDIPWAAMALVLILGRLCDPSSELSLAEKGFQRTALPELLGIPAAKVNDDRLYRALDQLLPAKAEVEKHLKARLGELFGLTYDLLLYDVTSTFFEGQAARNPQAQRGYSRDQRPDCKQVCIALVVTREGMPVGYEVFDGNRADVTTVETIVTTVEERYGKADRIWVMDRGMVSEANLAWLREGKRRYLVGTPKASMRRWEAELAGGKWEEVHQGLEVQLCPGPDADEVFILCRSAARREKEQAMRERAAEKLEAALQHLAEGCAKRRVAESKLHERIGRLRERYSRGSRLIETTVHSSPPAPAEAVETAAEPGAEPAPASGGPTVTWRRRERFADWSDLADGCYVLRSNVTEWTGEELWKAYIQLTEAEAAFRIQKDDLRLRPIWHQTKERVQAHLLVCFLCFVLWKTLGQLCAAAGLGDCPRQVFDELAQLRMVDVVLPTKNGVELRRRCIERPSEAQAVLLQRLGLHLPESWPLEDLS